MASFTGFPLNYAPLVHTDEDGTPIEQEKRHMLAQGWLQMFNSLNQIMQGRWEKTSVTNVSSVSNCTFTPYTANIYLEFNSDNANTILTFPNRYFGALFIYDSSNLLTQVIKVSGSSVSIPVINTGDWINGTLSA